MDSVAALFADLCTRVDDDDRGLEARFRALAGDIATDKDLCFWSGRAARVRAKAQLDALTDMDVPPLAWMWQQQPPSSATSFAISRWYAGLACRTAHVFLSSDKPAEATGLTVGINFWEAELPVLCARLHQNLLARIVFHVHNADTDTWALPIVGVHALPDALPVYRRVCHDLDEPSVHPSFVTDEKTQAEWDAWRVRPPRRGCSLRVLRACVAALSRRTRRAHRLSTTLRAESDAPDA